MHKKSLFSRLLPLLITVVTLLVIVVLVLSKPSIKRGAPTQKANLTVETMTVKPTEFTVNVTSFGRLEASLRTLLRAQVGGKVIYINPAFESGGVINKDEILVEIEKADFDITKLQAKASYIDAKRQLDEETARAKQAQADWNNAGRKDKPADLVLRKPQIAAAQARLLSAQAALDGAKLNLERATIKAPYAARVLSRQVDPFSVISPNTVIGEIFSTNHFDVTLPIKDNDYAFINTYVINQQTKPAQPTPTPSSTIPAPKLTPTPKSAKVALTWSSGSTLEKNNTANAYLIRASANIDEASRQPFVVARLTDPAKTPLKLGQYVTAKIRGKTIESAIVIPNSSIYQGQYIYVFSDNKIFRRDITPLWQSPSVTVVASGLTSGEQVVISPLGQVTSGTQVKKSNINAAKDTKRIKTDTLKKQSERKGAQP